MHHTYKTKGTCSSKIDFDLEDGIVQNVRFTGGCNGNLKGISALVEGKRAEEIASLLQGVQCGMKGTSCPDQLSRALTEAMAAQAG
ncbi:MAG: TIGR03905 family TSCPD domain-containing protein [Lachnospiraceae bacterium]|nr:TIGR03905 family TSCPD domain-containing protein [Lachnospiraceae bacterium]